MKKTDEKGRLELLSAIKTEISDIELALKVMYYATKTDDENLINTVLHRIRNLEDIFSDLLLDETPAKEILSDWDFKRIVKKPVSKTFTLSA